MTAFSLFVCRGDFEAAWIAGICAQQEREMEQWEIDEDRDHEERLARECVEDDETESWAWYADAPLEVEDPEIIDDADLMGMPVEAPDIVEDDEVPVTYAEADDEEDFGPRWL